MTDKELLELAAKAAGYLLEDDDDEGLSWVVWDENNNPTDWNPLTDDGDALRLAVKLFLTVEVWGDNAFDKANSCCTRKDISTMRVLHNDDPYSATRRAIVRAAAEIGKTL